MALLSEAPFASESLGPRLSSWGPSCVACHSFPGLSGLPGCELSLHWTVTHRGCGAGQKPQCPFYRRVRKGRKQTFRAHCSPGPSAHFLYSAQPSYLCMRQVIVPIFQMRTLRLGKFKGFTPDHHPSSNRVGHEALLYPWVITTFLAPVIVTWIRPRTQTHTRVASPVTFIVFCAPSTCLLVPGGCLCEYPGLCPPRTPPVWVVCPEKGLAVLRRSRAQAAIPRPSTVHSLDGPPFSHHTHSWLGWSLSPLSICHSVVLP